MRPQQIFSIVFICTGFLSVIYLLWTEELRFYIPVKSAQKIDKEAFRNSSFLISGQKPAYLHYFDSHCKQSRINIQHIGQIMDDYEDEFDFYVININGEIGEEFLRKHKLPDYVSIVDDTNQEIALNHQIASTPFVSIIDRKGNLIFRGNYTNENGFCGSSDIKNSAPSMALSFIAKHDIPPISLGNQLETFGCTINKNQK